MKHISQKTMWLMLILFLIIGTSNSYAQKKELEHSDYAKWSRITEKFISNNGQWLLYSYAPEEHDGILKIKSLKGNKTFQIIRGDSARFNPDSRFVFTKIKAPVDSVKMAKREKRKGPEFPKDSLAVINLSNGTITKMANVKSYKMPEKNGEWLAYQLSGKTSEEDTSKVEKKEKKKKVDEGTELVLRNLSNNKERTFPFVKNYLFSKNGDYLAFSRASKDTLQNGVYFVDLKSGRETTVLKGPGKYAKLAFDDAGKQLAFLSDTKNHIADQPVYSLYYCNLKKGDTRMLATEKSAGIPTGWWVSKYGKVSFSKNGKRVYFGTKPKPAPEPKEKTPDDEKVVLDLWSWTDPLIQPQQKVELKEEERRTYLAMVDIKKGNIVQLADESLPTVRVGNEGDADIAVGLSNMPYRQEISWDYPSYYDIYLVNVKTGKRDMVLKKLQSGAELSPDARYIDWWDRNKLAWFAMDVKNRKVVNISKNVPFPVYNELHDWPYKPNPYGRTGWTKDDKSFLVYDRFDIWSLDPTGRKAPENITDGIGRKDSLRFRYLRLDPDEKAIDPAKPMLLSAFNIYSKKDGFYRDQINESKMPLKLVMKDESFSGPVKAKDANELLFTRETFQEFPDLWVSGMDFTTMKRMSDVNPQQKDYLWGSDHLVNFTSMDGKPLQGILCEPANFNPHKKYPMIVYFYERTSDYLHHYWIPAPGRSIINFSFYASRGYLIFIPDISYKVGYPGQSALDAIMPGTLHIIDKGFVDTKNIGIQGHSWGGYEVAYLVTQTNMFKAAESGAPVSDMISSYGGIRWGSGMSRMFQYEKTQSRIGGTLWQYPLRYINNSPVYFADKIQTPLLILCNDHDTAVPWYQGIEFFLALRRLHKPAWLLDYNGEPHWPTKYQNRMDFTIRMQQYFDHYLKGAPAPVWMVKGIPAIEKGKTLGLELMKKKK